MKRIVVTGSTGFLGRHLMTRLEGHLDQIGAQYSLHGSTGDLTDPRVAGALFMTRRPTLLFHLAAVVGGIGLNQKRPGTMFRENILMGVNVMDAARELLDRGSDKCKVVLVGTCCSYPKTAPLPIRETSLWDGYPEETNAAYGVAKRALVTMADAYRQEFGLDIATVIPANLYGPADNFNLETSHVIPAMIRKIFEAHEAGKPSVELWGDGTPTREFLFVEDCADMIMRIGLEHDHILEPINIGSGSMIQIAELADMIATIIGYGGTIEWDYTKPNGQPRRVLDLSRSRLFGLQSKMPLEQGLRETVMWYLENR